MAYNFNDEKQVEIAMLKKNDRGEYYKITRIIPGNNRLESVDMRLMYTDDSDNIRPTKKGVRVSTEDIVQFTVAIIQSLSAEEREEVLDGLKDLGLYNDTIED